MKRVLVAVLMLVMIGSVALAQGNSGKNKTTLASTMIVDANDKVVGPFFANRVALQWDDPQQPQAQFGPFTFLQFDGQWVRVGVDTTGFRQLGNADRQGSLGVGPPSSSGPQGNDIERPKVMGSTDAGEVNTFRSRSPNRRPMLKG